MVKDPLGKFSPSDILVSLANALKPVKLLSSLDMFHSFNFKAMLQWLESKRKQYLQHPNSISNELFPHKIHSGTMHHRPQSLNACNFIDNLYLF